MKILLIGNYLKLASGNPNPLIDLSRYFSNKGHTVFTTSSKKSKILRLLDMLYSIWSLRSSYDIAEVDVFSGQAFIFAFLSAILLRQVQKPFVLMLHGGNLPEFARTHPNQIKKLLNSASAVVVPSNYLMQAFMNYRSDITIIPNALYIEQYSFKIRNLSKPNLVWLRAFHEIYNPELAIRVLAIIDENFPDSQLWMIGPDKGDNSYSRTRLLAKQFGVEKSVHFIEGVPKKEVPQWLNRGDIFLNTTNFDNTPVSVIEAMACGLCVVSTDVGGLPYLIDDEVNGLLVPPNDATALAAAIERVLSEPGLAERLSANARAKVENFDWSKVLPLWEKVIESLI